jgi:hypothetical protein
LRNQTDQGTSSWQKYSNSPARSALCNYCN